MLRWIAQQDVGDEVLGAVGVGDATMHERAQLRR